MTGGAGFSRSSMQSFRDNHSLGKVRPQLKAEEKSRSGKNASKKDISLAFRLHQEQRQRSYLRKKFISRLIFVLLMAFLIWLFFN